MELLGEYIGLEGQRQQLRVPCEAPGVTDPFQSLLSGVAQMRELVTELFGSQVQPEAQDRGTAAPDEALDGDLPNPGIEPRSPAMQVDSLPTEPQGNPRNTGVGSLTLLQRIFPTQEGEVTANW